MRLISAIDRLNPFAPILVDAAVRGAIVLLAALAITHLLRRRNAAVRHLIWVGAIVIQLLLPVFAYWGPKWKVPVPSVVTSVTPVVIVNAPQVTLTPAATSASHDEVIVSTSTPKPVPPKTTGTQVLLTLWVLGALLVLARLAIGTTVVARLARAGNRIDDGNWLSLAQRLSTTLGIDRPLTLLRGTRLGVPVTWGIVYPVVLLPEDADAWSEERRRFVLVHEMAHVKRLDALTQLAGQFALALFWFNPLVWIANRRMQMEREHACDDYVIRHGTAPSMYAEELLTMVRALGSPNQRDAQPAFAALAMARRSEFEGRMLSILDPVLDRHPLSKGRTLLSALLALILVVPLAALQPYQALPVAATTAQVAQQSQAAAKADLPESFKISIMPAEPTVSAATVRTAAPASTPTPAARAETASTWRSGFSFVTTSGKAPSCDVSASSSSSTSTHVHTENDNDGSVSINYVSYNSELCASAAISGQVKFAADEHDIVDMGPGSQALFRERSGDLDRELRVSATGNGTVPLVVFGGSSTPQRESPRFYFSYRRNGIPSNYDEDARRWFAAFLPRVLMETGMNVAPRVARWRREGGVSKVLEQIEPLASSSAKRAHYEALLATHDLSEDDLEKVVESVSSHLSSSTDMRAVLVRAAPRTRASKDVVAALERAMTTIAGSTDKAAVVQTYGQSDDREMLLSVMRVTATISSSGDRARVLESLASRYLTKNDRALEDAFFDVTAEVPSAGDLRSVLMVAMPYAAGSTSVAARIIKVAHTVASSGDQSAVLIALVGSGALVNKTLRDAFFDAAAEVPSEGDRARVLQTAVGIRP